MADHKQPAAIRTGCAHLCQSQCRARSGRNEQRQMHRVLVGPPGTTINNPQPEGMPLIFFKFPALTGAPEFVFNRIKYAVCRSFVKCDPNLFISIVHAANQVSTPNASVWLSTENINSVSWAHNGAAWKLAETKNNAQPHGRPASPQAAHPNDYLQLSQRRRYSAES